MTRSSPLHRLQNLAHEQWGLVTRRQMEAQGVSPASIHRMSRDGASLERVATGVYRFVGAPTADHEALRAAWLQLQPDVPAWERDAQSGIVSHRAAASLFGFGTLPADCFDFTVGSRRQPFRPDVKIRTRSIGSDEWMRLTGLPVTRPARIVSDLLFDREDPVAVADIAVGALDLGIEPPRRFIHALDIHAHRFGLRSDDGRGLFAWLLGLSGHARRDEWLAIADDELANFSKENSR